MKDKYQILEMSNKYRSKLKAVMFTHAGYDNDYTNRRMDELTIQCKLLSIILEIPLDLGTMYGDAQQEWKKQYEADKNIKSNN